MNIVKIVFFLMIYLELMGIYLSKVKILVEFKNGVMIVILNDGVNELCVLLLL